MRSFIDYKQTLFQLVNILFKLKDYSIKLKLDRTTKSIEQAIERIETNSFSIAIVGEFKRGKSTLINALLGAEILPANVLPTTATLNRIRYGLKPVVKIIFKDGQEKQISIDRLSNYVTKITEASKATATSVQEAIVYYPFRYGQQNLEIVDTPGLSDEANMNEVTLAILPHIDLAIFVIMAQSPFSATEKSFLENYLLTKSNQDLAKIIFVITGIDRLNSAEEIDRIVNSIKKRIQEQILQKVTAQFGRDSIQSKSYLSRLGELKVFDISAYQALNAKINRDHNLLLQSRFLSFENFLEQFLTEERGETLLQVSIHQATTFSQKIIQAIDDKNHALYRQEVEFMKTYEDNLVRLTQRIKEKKDSIYNLDTLAEIEQIQNQIIEARLTWERTKTLMEIQHQQTQSMLAEVRTLQQEIATLAIQLDRTMETLCYHCHRLNQSDSNFCIHCGTQLICTHCRTKVYHDSLLCLNCGTTLKRY